VPTVRTGDDLATVMDTFAKHDLQRLPVTVTGDSAKVIGWISRSALMKRYQAALAE
jgi:CBS-domain-containing membrane protein